MIPILFEKTERSFITNGICRLYDMISAEVVEERNGVYELDFQYPVDGANYDKIQCGRVVGVIHDDTKTVQPFDIVSYTRPLNGIVTFHCVHISYRLTGYTMMASSVANIQEAILSLTNAGTPFEFDYKVMRYGYMSIANGLPVSVRQFIGGAEGSMLDTYGGEIEWDKFKVTFYKDRGQVTDFKIRYGLNLVDYEDSSDFSGTYNQCVPYWTDGQNTIYGDVVSSGFNTYTGRDICVPLDLSDKFEPFPTKEQLEEKALQHMQNNQTNLPRQNIKVDFIRLQDSPEYEQFESLLQCRLCDSIGVVFPMYGMQGNFKIVRTVYDVLGERFTEMELGALSVSLSEALGIENGQSTLTSSTNPEDYIIEENTSGIWTYRKWASGTVELWGNGTVASSSITLNVLSSSANLYYTNSFGLSLPFTVINGAVSVSVGSIASNVGWATNQRQSDSTHISFTVVKYSNTAGNMTYSAYVIGRWK